MDKLKQAFSYTKASQQRRKAKKSKEKQGGKQRTAAAVFFGTFGALTDAHFLHAIYHFKAQEVKNPTLQTVYDLELKRGIYGLRKTTAPGLCETRTPPQPCEWCAKLAHPLSVRMVCETRTPPQLCERCAKLAYHSHTPLRGANFPLFLPTPHEIFSFRYFCINFHSSPCNPPIIRFLS